MKLSFCGCSSNSINYCLSGPQSIISKWGSPATWSSRRNNLLVAPQRKEVMLMKTSWIMQATTPAGSLMVYQPDLLSLLYTLIITHLVLFVNYFLKFFWKIFGPAEETRTLHRSSTSISLMSVSTGNLFLPHCRCDIRDMYVMHCIYLTHIL